MAIGSLAFDKGKTPKGNRFPWGLHIGTVQNLLLMRTPKDQG
jgi:hypothetical protein